MGGHVNNGQHVNNGYCWWGVMSIIDSMSIMDTVGGGVMSIMDSMSIMDNVGGGSCQ